MPCNDAFASSAFHDKIQSWFSSKTCHPFGLSWFPPSRHSCLLRAMSNHTSRLHLSLLSGEMMFGLKKRVPGLDTPKWDQGYWEGVCVWAWSGNTGHVMRETAWPCSSFIRSFKDHKHPPVCTAQLQGTWACLLGCEGHTQDLSTTGPCPYHVEDDLTQRESRGRLTATLQLLWEQLEEMHSNVVSQLLGKQKKSSL